MAHGGRRPGAGRTADAGGPTSPLTIRVTDAERALWEDAAAAAGMSLRDWIRAACDAWAASAPSRNH
jgi:uncharacterized protein (DUF1778 family)